MFDCVVPAAGASSRMRDAEGRSLYKPLLPFAGSTMVETTVGAALAAGCRVLLVIGHEASRLEAVFGSDSYRGPRREGRLLLLPNPRWESGLLGSIQSALSAVEGAAFFIALADMPFIGSDSYRALEAARARLRAAVPVPGPELAVIAAHEGRRGHPTLVPSAWIPELLSLDPRGSMRDFLRSRPQSLVEAGPEALRDIDSLPDYEAAGKQ